MKFYQIYHAKFLMPVCMYVYGNVCAVINSVFFFQVAQHQGYIKINWSKVNKEMEETKRKLQKETQRQYPRLLNEVQLFQL